MEESRIYVFQVVDELFYIVRRNPQKPKIKFTGSILLEKSVELFICFFKPMNKGTLMKIYCLSNVDLICFFINQAINTTVGF